MIAIKALWNGLRCFPPQLHIAFDSRASPRVLLPKSLNFIHKSKFKYRLHWDSVNSWLYTAVTQNTRLWVSCTLCFQVYASADILTSPNWISNRLKASNGWLLRGCLLEPWYISSTKAENIHGLWSKLAESSRCSIHKVLLDASVVYYAERSTVGYRCWGR